MRISTLSLISLLACSSILLFSCDEKEEFTSDKVSDYQPLAAGKYITYRLDSLVTVDFDTRTEIHKYQVKHVVDAQLTDNLGRPAWRVYRYIRDSVNTTSWTPAQPWVPNGSYFITPLGDQLEVVEDNLRFIKLHLPVRNGFSWKGNRYLPTEPYSSKYSFSNDNSMEDWDYYYDGDLTPFSYKGINYGDVLTVEQADEIFNIPVTAPTAFGSVTRSVDRYQKNLGLVFREHSLYEYQPPRNGLPATYVGFGVKMWMIDHN